MINNAKRHGKKPLSKTHKSEVNKYSGTIVLLAGNRSFPNTNYVPQRGLDAWAELPGDYPSEAKHTNSTLEVVGEVLG